MGEIGIDRKEFLYELRHWEIKEIIAGYRNRARTSWEAARFNAFFIMSAMTDLRKAGIRTDRDLYTFPWEKKGVESSSSDQPTAEKVKAIRKMIEEENKSRTS